MKIKSFKIKRNGRCRCGSGKKLKHCCIDKVKRCQKTNEIGRDPLFIEKKDFIIYDK